MSPCHHIARVPSFRDGPKGQTRNLDDDEIQRKPMSGFRIRACARTRNDGRGNYRSLIGGAVFSAGAGGNAGVAPDFCAWISGRAGSGAGVVGRSPPGLDSAGGVSWGAGVGEDCNGCVACATCGLLPLSWASERPATVSPTATIADARSISLL